MGLLTQITQANKINYPTCQMVAGEHDQQLYRCDVRQANLSIRVIKFDFLTQLLNYQQSEGEVPFNEEHSYPPSALSPLFNQALQSQHATCSSSSILCASHGTESIGRGMAISDSAQRMYEYICEKIKVWYYRGFNYLSTRLQIIRLFELETFSSSYTSQFTEIKVFVSCAFKVAFMCRISEAQEPLC